MIINFITHPERLRPSHRIVVAGLTAAIAVATAAVAGAISTRAFVLDDAKTLAKGELDGAAVYSDGSIQRGAAARRIDLPNVAVAHCLASDGESTAYVGTGNKGQIYRVTGNQAELYAETGQLLVSALALRADGTLYAGTLPDAKIYAIEAGKARELIDLQADHVWALVWDERRKTLFAATGPEGKVFAVDPQGNASLYYDAKAKHVMSLDFDGQGGLYAGTSDEALLLHLRGPGQVEVVYDFPGEEVTAIAVGKGGIAVAANEFPEPKTSKAKKSRPGATTSRSKSRRSKRPKPGKGQLWRVARDGRSERLHKLDDGHFTRVRWGRDGSIYAAAGQDGRIHRVTRDGTHAVWLDVDERQVLDLDLDAKLLVTGDVGAVYRMVEGAQAAANWTSHALDARFDARWGQLRWRGRGKVAFRTRSGNTEKPDDTWSDWSARLTAPGPIRSAGARFLQVQATLLEPDAVIYAATAFYLPRNQPAVVRDIEVEPKRTKKKKGSDGAQPEEQEPTSVYLVKWKAENRDKDRLRYRLQYRQEGQGRWREILREHQVLTEEKHEWQTDALPDGYYRIRVQASDELANPPRLSTRSGTLSEPVLIDNRRPRVSELRLSATRLSGRARDEMGPISRLEYAIDGGEWRMFFPADDLFDTKDERFDIVLDELTPGSHIIAVRATDAAGNTGTAELTTR